MHSLSHEHVPFSDSFYERLLVSQIKVVARFMRQIVQVRNAANITQAVYGSRSAPARGSNTQKIANIARITVNKTRISASAIPGLWSLKKIQVQAVFKNSWTINSTRGKMAILKS